MHAGLAILGSNVIETKQLIQNHSIGLTIHDHNPLTISNAINKMLSNQILLNTWKENSIKESKRYKWENEEKKLLKIYENI